MRTTTPPTALAVLYSFPHVLGSPGIGRTAWHQVVGLARAGHDVTVVAAAVERPLPPEVRVVRTLAVGGHRIPHRVFGRRDRALGWHDRIAARVLAAGAFDLVHGWPLASARTFRAARELGVVAFREAPNTHTEHAYRVVAEEIARLGGSLANDNPHRFNAARLHVEQREWSLADIVLVPSEVVQRTFLDAGWSPRHLARHRYGCEVQELGARDPGRSGAGLIAIFAGRCEPRKGLHHALDAWIASSASHRGRFLIYGAFVPGYRALLGERLQHPSVEVLGFDAEVSSRLQSADVLLLPSVEEGSALVTYEAQAAGCVPLASSAAGAMIENGVHGLLHEPGDVAALTEQLDRLDRDPGLLRTMRQACLARRDELGWDSAAAALIAAYREGLARAASPASARPATPDDLAVLICSRDRPGLLAGALAATLASIPAGVEIVVVDSASRTAETAGVVAAAGVRSVRLDRPGLSIARNAAIAATDREIVVFTDDDCEPAPGWIAPLLSAFADPRVGAVTGTIVAGAAATPPRRFRRVWQGLDAGHGAVMAFRREALVAAGGFDEVLGAGRRLAGAEDLDMFARLIRDGWIVQHDPAVHVAHVQDRVGDAHRALLAGYGRGLGGMIGKFLRHDPAEGLRMGVVMTRRLALRTVRTALAGRTVRPDLAMLGGMLTGTVAGLTTSQRDGRMVDRTPPALIMVEDDRATVSAVRDVV